MAGEKTALSKELGGAAIVKQLSEAESAELLGMIKTVRKSRFKAMLSSIDEALDHLPRMLRGPAKKILGV